MCFMLLLLRLQSNSQYGSMCSYVPCWLRGAQCSVGVADNTPLLRMRECPLPCCCGANNNLLIDLQ